MNNDELPVHCCCNASRRLGYLRVPTPCPPKLIYPLPEGGELELEVGIVHSYRGPSFRAVKSMDTPLEILQKLPGWRDVR